MNKGMIDLDPTRYEAMTSTPPELVTDILTATHSVYLAALATPFARANNMKYTDAKRAPHCLQTSEEIATHLNGLSRGYEADISARYFGPKHLMHFVTEISASEIDEPIIADATWQQFLPERGFGIRLGERLWRRPPEVLIGTPQEVARVAMGYGFSKEQARSWTPRPA